MRHSPIAAGGSSFDLIDAQKLFAEISLKSSRRFLDLACGFGHYAIAASFHVGKAGFVVAVDLWQDGLDHLSHFIKANNLFNIQAVLADARKKIPLKGSSIDLCLLATVLHDFMHEKTEEGVLQEIHRVLKVGGKFAVVEFKKIASKPGPPIEIRITPEQVNETVIPHGFEFLKTVEIGQFHYLSLFEKTKA